MAISVKESKADIPPPTPNFNAFSSSSFPHFFSATFIIVQLRNYFNLMIFLLHEQGKICQFFQHYSVRLLFLLLLLGIIVPIGSDC